MKLKLPANSYERPKCSLIPKLLMYQAMKINDQTVFCAQTDVYLSSPHSITFRVNYFMYLLFNHVPYFAVIFR